MTVYVAHDIKDDIGPARKFGQVRYVNRFYIHGDELDRSNDEKNVIPRGYLANMERCLADFNPDADYLLIAGDHLQLLALTAILIGKSGYLDVLRWDRQLGEYIPVRLHSGLVPPRRSVLVSGTDIGDTEHGESRSSLKDLGEIDAGSVIERHRAALEAPLARRDPTKRTS